MAPGLSSSDASASSNDSFATALESPLPPSELTGLALTLEFFKYVDDTTVVKIVSKELGVRHISTASPQEVIPAPLLEPLMVELIQEVESKGMRVNCAKTQMIVISNDTGYNVSAAITAGGVQIQSVDSMKLLGFMVSGSGMAAQVAFIKTKFRRKFWSLIHLRRSGIQGDHLFILYCLLLRPVIESNSVVYHSMLNRSQANDIEKLQKKVLRLCYGNFMSHPNLCEEKSVETMEERRSNAIRKFTSNVMKNDRFANKWLVRREEVHVNLRDRRPLIENAARTSRYLNSPLLFIQKTANDLMTTNNK